MNSKLQEPLLSSSTDRIDASVIRSTALTLGLLVGFFIQASTLGSNYLLLISTEASEWLSRSQNTILLFTLLWSTFTTLVSFYILHILRIYLSFGTTTRDDHHTDTVVQMECRFVAGILVGVCSAWAIADFCMGYRSLSSFVTVLVVIVGYRSLMRGMMWFFAVVPPVNANDDDDDLEETLV